MNERETTQVGILLDALSADSVEKRVVEATFEGVTVPVVVGLLSGSFVAAGAGQPLAILVTDEVFRRLVPPASFRVGNVGDQAGDVA